MIQFKPCGACVALVSADEGCEHWKPKNRARKHSTSKNPDYLAQKNERRRINQQAARERARADVAAFRAMMTQREAYE